jgi:hypothetical protein
MSWIDDMYTGNFRRTSNLFANFIFLGMGIHFLIKLSIFCISLKIEHDSGDLLLTKLFANNYTWSNIQCYIEKNSNLYSLFNHIV